MQQITTKKAPAAPTVVYTPAGEQTVTGKIVDARELTTADVKAIRQRLKDLRSELQDAAERRNSISEHLSEADAAARPGYLARLEILDKRILSIENEITSLVALMGTAPPGALDAFAQ